MPITQNNADILIISDGAGRWDAQGALRGVFAVADWPLDATLDTSGPNNIVDRPVVIDVDLTAGAGYDRVKAKLKYHKAGRVALLRTHNRRAILRAHELGAKDYHVYPVDEVELCTDLQAMLNQSAESKWETLTQTQRAALRVGLKCFELCMGKAANGDPLPVEAVRTSTQHILEATKDTSLDGWTDTLRQHHNYTFRHSMHVTGTVSIFAQSIGIGGRDLEHLTAGGMLHDVGKAQISNELLNKPGKLSDEEWEILRQHPDNARAILETDVGLAPEIADIAIHHHEALDGSGYPSGLKGAQVNDFVRLVAIADIYSALLDKRAYKPSYSKSEALEIMEGMTNQLDQALLKPFREFVLDNTD